MSERRYPIKTLVLGIDDVKIGENEKLIYIDIGWFEKSIGWGQYAFNYYKKEAEWIADSEYMDWGEDKDFGRALWKRLLKYKESEPEEYKEIITKEEEDLLLKLVNEATEREDKELNEKLLMKFMDNIKEIC